MTTKQEQVFRALINLDMGRPFPAKFAGVCALTGMKFNAYDLIRKVGEGYCSQRALGLACIVGQAPLEAQIERTAPFDADKLQQWLAGGAAVAVYGKTGAFKVYRGGQQSEAQLRARTRQGVWMVKA